MKKLHESCDEIINSGAKRKPEAVCCGLSGYGSLLYQFPELVKQMLAYLSQCGGESQLIGRLCVADKRHFLRFVVSALLELDFDFI